MLRRKRAGKQGVGVRVERKIFHSLETAWRDGAELVHSTACLGLRREAGGQGGHSAEAALGARGYGF